MTLLQGREGPGPTGPALESFKGGYTLVIEDDGGEGGWRGVVMVVVVVAVVVVVVVVVVEVDWRPHTTRSTPVC